MTCRRSTATTRSPTTSSRPGPGAEPLPAAAETARVVLGVDPGSRVTGWGLVRQHGNRVQHVDNGIIAPSTKLDLHERIAAIHQGLRELIDRHRPGVMAIEDIFVHRNARSALLLGHARGVALLAAAQTGLEVCAYSPSEVKQSVTGNGRAEKSQVAEMVRLLVSLPQVAASDASDALAVALCHTQRSGFQRLTAAALGGRRR